MKEKLEIGTRLKEFCEKKFKNYAEASNKLGFKNPNQIYDYFNGRSILSGEKLSILSAEGCDIDWLLTGRGGMFNTAIVAEPVAVYGNEILKSLEDEITKLKAENYDLRKEIDILREQQNK